MRRLTGALLLAAAHAGVAAAQGAERPRALADRPDELAGHQIHLIYAVPRDGTDRRLDVNGAVAASVRAAQRWLAAASGGRRLRIDRFDGAPDVTFHRLARTADEIAAHGAHVRDELEALLAAAGFDHSTKLYAVYYDGPSGYACGGGAWPPTLPGRVAALYLRAAPGGRPCGPEGLADGFAAAGYWEHSLIHEILHTLGYVAACAPNHHRAGHAADDPADLMYAGEEAWRPRFVDLGRDDYFRHGRPDCPDLARSAFLDPSPAAPELPPGWPRAVE